MEKRKQNFKSRRNLIGKKFGRLLVIEYGLGAERSNGKGFTWTPTWLCYCECGNEKEVDYKNLLNGNVKSCGCLARDQLVKRNTKHGKYHSREHRSWLGARSRCMNKNNKNYNSYGGRGIKFSDDWNDFNVFLKDMGECPPRYSLNRIDNDGDYCKENCEWASSESQANNRTSSIRIEHLGKFLSIRELSKMYGYTYQQLNNQLIRNGLDIKNALSRLDKLNKRRKK